MREASQTITPPSTCGTPWCVYDERLDAASADSERLSPEDFHTWHHGPSRTLREERHLDLLARRDLRQLLVHLDQAVRLGQ